MHNSNIPADRELPSSKQLIKSTVLAAIGAGILLVTVVMPAEYGIDPTGIGKLTGLQQMGEIRVSLEEEAAQEEAAKLAAATQSTATQTNAPATETQPPAGTVELRSDTTTFNLAPNEGAEIKVTLQKGEVVTYTWSSTGKINFDNHGDSKELNIDYHGYGKGISQESDAGEIEAAFDGSHGWFWRNRTKETVTVTLETSGRYSDIKRVD